jgi:hypothetical protein
LTHRNQAIEPSRSRRFSQLVRMAMRSGRSVCTRNLRSRR